MIEASSPDEYIEIMAPFSSETLFSSPLNTIFLVSNPTSPFRILVVPVGDKYACDTK